MVRLIEILQEFQNNSFTLSLSYLTAKFSLTIRTLQRDIQRINSLLSEISNCKIVKSKDQLILIGDNANIAINSLLRKFLNFSNNNVTRTHWILLSFIWENQPLTDSKLLNFTEGNRYSLKQELNLINKLFQYYQLNLSLKFKIKKGWSLVGCEEDLRLLAANILIDLSHNANTLEKKSDYLTNLTNYLDVNLFYLFDKLEKLLSANNIYQYYYPEILAFLTVVVRRIKINELLNNYHCHLLLKQVIDDDKMLAKHCDQIINLLQNEFTLKINEYEKAYLKSVMFFKQKHFSNLFLNFILAIKSFINDLVFKKYRISLKVKSFNTILEQFLQENCLSLLLGSQLFNFNDLKTNCSFVDDRYCYGWQILMIIKFAFQEFNIDFKDNLFKNDYFLMNFSSLYLWSNQGNWLIPLYYQENSDSYSQLNKILLFIKHAYPNLSLKALKINNEFYQQHFLNKQYTIFLDQIPTLDFSQFKQIFPIKYHHLSLNHHLQTNLDLTIKMIMFNKIRSSISVFDFFTKQKFANLKTLLSFLQHFLVRKFKLNYLDFDLTDAFINQKFLQAKILLINKLIPINNIELPIILIYLKNPLFFHRRNPIHFIFILITNSNNLFQYNWIILYLDFIKNNFNVQITSIKNIYQILNNSLSHRLPVN